ncbi:MAG: hypothetical protein Q7S74_01575 [Nanoarchaeota archaeon]|nr:hypothetical protein [Nanoarchaeota archaeon]
MYKSFDHLIKEHDVERKFHYSGSRVVVVPDACFFRNINTCFFQDMQEKYELRFVKGVLGEIHEALRQEFKVDLSTYYKRKSLFYSIPSIKVEVSENDELLISKAAKEAYDGLPQKMKKNRRNMKYNGIGNVDMQQITYLLQRARKGLSTLALTNDIGVITTIAELRKDDSFNGFIDGKTVVISSIRHINEKYAA